MKFRNGQAVYQGTLEEILVYLASEGVFDVRDVPDWAADGTMFEEVFLALRALGERAESDGVGVRPEFDKWFSNFCRGKEVPDPHLIVVDDE